MALLFTELSLIMAVVLVISLLMQKIKQPLLIGYIITGIIVGPLFFNFLTADIDSYEAFSHIGVALLLFIVGLNLNVKLIKEVGFVSLITGLGQVFFTSLVGFMIATFLGFSVVASILIAIGLTFSSTIIIIKLLSDKKDLDTLYGKISLGFLLVQDLVAVIVLMVVSSVLKVAGSTSLYTVIMETLFFGFIAIIFTFILAKYFIPPFLDRIAHSRELLFLFVIAWCFGFANLFSVLGFSVEIGALLAGVSLASSSYQYEISSRVKPLRDFFIVMFFILLGSQMVPEIAPDMVFNSLSDKLLFMYGSIEPLLIPALIFSLFVVIGNPIIVFSLMSLMRYSSRTSFMAGLTVAQISEFSLILAILAKDAGFLTSEEVSMLTLVGIITITISTYLIMNSERVYRVLCPLLTKFERHRLRDTKKGVKDKKYDIFVFGSDRIGYSILKILKANDRPYLVVDNDPRLVKSLKGRGMNVVYGDVSSSELLQSLDYSETKLIISTVPDSETNFLILKEIKNKYPDIQVILTANHVDDALQLYEKGAGYVVLPHFLGGEYLAGLIDSAGDYRKLLDEKIKHINELKDRKDLGHEHPKH